MAHPEGGSFWGGIKKFFEGLFRKKLAIEKAEEFERQMREAEVKRARQEARERTEREDKLKKYRERQSGEEVVEGLDAARRIRVEEIKKHFEDFIREQGRAGSGYLVDLVRDDTLKGKIFNLIENNPGAANLLDVLATKGKELHGDPASLINLGRSLILEAEKTPDGREAINPLLSAMKDRAITLMPDAIRVYNERARRERQATSNVPIWLSNQLELQITNEQQKKLIDSEHPEKWVEAIEEMFSRSAATTPSTDTSWVDVGETPRPAGIGKPPKQLVDAVDAIWQKVDRSEKAGSHLSVDEIQQLEREILASESKSFPKDVFPGTTAYNETVSAAYTFVEDRLNRLANKLEERLKSERPPVRQGIIDTSVFLDEMVRNPGRLGGLLELNPEMEKLLVGDIPLTGDREKDKEALNRSVRFRNQVFLTIHSAILTDRNSSANENFGLYERADFTTFTSLLRSKMADRIRPETGLPYGRTWVEWYANLSNTIRLSRDIDFWAAQPGASIDDFSKSLALFQNHYSAQALSIPAVEQAYRAYEDTLQSIRDSNDGYIPPAMIGYEGGHMISYWDTQAQLMLERMIQAGVVHDAKRDMGGFHVVDKDGNTVLLGDKLDIDTLKKEDKQDLELSMYMTLAKGFGLASLRYLEMFANSRVPGSQQPGFEVGKDFHSTPYEGPARALNYFSTMIHKWKFGSYRYLHMMNTLLPEKDKIRHIDANEPMKAYIAMRDGTFKQKYGAGAKRLIDKLNFSGFSSAFGPPYTKWRHMDTTKGWSDKQRELLGGPTQIMYSSKFASERVKEFLVVGKYREMFRQAMRTAGAPTSGPAFDALWQERGAPKYNHQIESDWEKLNKNHKVKHQIEHLVGKYKKAFVARVWTEMTMRNPLAVAHNLEVEVKDKKLGGKKKIKLHSYLIEEILGISPEDLKYGDTTGKAAAYSSPSEKQRRYIAEVMGLEADLMAVRERAIAENRELTEDDFNIISSPKNRDQAKDYWNKIRQAMLGSTDPGRHNELYKKFGLAMGDNEEFFAVDWKEIEKIDHILEDLEKNTSGLADVSEGKILLNKELADHEWEFIFGSDDTAYRKMAILNLGPRQWVRRGGDAAAHYHGGERVGQYLGKDLIGNPDVHDLAKALLEVRQAYEGDMIEAGWQVAGFLTHGTARLYAFDYKKLGSAAQIDVWKTRRNIAAWTANGRRAFFDAVEHLDVLPPHHETALGAYDIPEWTDIHTLRKIDRADLKDVWTEIVLLGVALAIAITIYRAFTAPSEEEEGGGGGGGGHH